MSYYPDSEARTDPRLLLIQRAERGAARARQFQRRRRIAIVTFLGLALAIGVAGKALAWHVLPGDAERTCKSLTLSTVVPDEDWFTGNATLTFQGKSASRSTPGPLSVTVDLGKSAPAGTASGTVSWSDSGETEPVSASYGKAPEGCIPPPPPPAKQGSAGVTTTCNSVTFNFNFASPGVEQYAKVDGQIKRPATLNGSVTFKGLAPGEHPSEYGSGTNVQRGSFEALDCTPAEKKGDDFAGTATDLHRAGPPDQHGPPSPPVDTPGQLPFTGPREWLLPLGLTLFVAGAVMVLAGRRTYQRMLRSVEPVKSSWGETRVRPDRDSADTNLLTTLFHRFHR